MTKRVFLTALMICLLIMPARAEGLPNQLPLDSPQNDCVAVGTLEELKEAIAAADDGDIIELTQTIIIFNKTISTDKDITITCAENFEGSEMFNVMGTSVTGLSFKGCEVSRIFSVIDYQGKETVFQDCLFDGDNTSVAITVYGTATENHVSIIDSEFKNCFRNAIIARASTDVVIDRCYIHGTYAIDASAAVQSSGKITLNDCIITGNTSFANAGVLCSGTLIISGGQIRNNAIMSTEKGVAVDVFCSGAWSIIDEETENAGYYDAVTGEKLALPIYENDALARLIYLEDEDAKDYFSFLTEPNVPEMPPQKPTSPPTGGENGNNTEHPSEPPQEPVQPSVGEDKENSNQQPEGPTEPPQDSGEDGSNSDTVQAPQTPPEDYRPSTRPPVTVKPTDTNKPQETAGSTPVPAQPPLICNGATIDVFHSVVLLGYGDGLIHEDDFLTRAQMATVIFRLLDDDSIVLYRDAQLDFVDVPANAWYTDYVRVIQAAGIVNGIGGGRYNPDGLLTWGQTLAILSRFVEPQEYALQHIQYNGWALQAVQTAVAYGWIEDSVAFAPNAVISRGQLEELINSVLALYR